VQYRVAAVWGAHEGSLLLWACILSVWTLRSLSIVAACTGHGRARHRRDGPDQRRFHTVHAHHLQPLRASVPGRTGCRDLNPLLQDPGLIFHPPMLYMGYVGFSVAFAFAIAACSAGISMPPGRAGRGPGPSSPGLFSPPASPSAVGGPTTNSAGPAGGSGSGGERLVHAWLVGTALIHSLAVTEKRGAFKPWTVLLQFSLSRCRCSAPSWSAPACWCRCMPSPRPRPRRVHSRLPRHRHRQFTGVVCVARAAREKAAAPSAGFSRESLLLNQHVILVTAAVSVLLGTLYPLILDALGLGKISVGPPYFATVFVPLMLPLAVLIGIGPLTRWKQDDPTTVMRRLLPYLIGATVSGVALLYAVAQHMSIMTALSVVIALWVFATALRRPVRTRAQSQGGWRSVHALSSA